MKSTKKKQNKTKQKKMVGSLVDHKAYKPYTLVGPPVLRPVLAP